jgi:HSP20 family protein
VILQHWSEPDELRQRPWSDFFRFSRAIQEVWSGPIPAQPVIVPRINVWARSDSAIVIAEVPGIAPHSFVVSIQGRTLLLGGRRQPPEVDSSDTCHCRERRYDRFSRMVELPFDVEMDGMQASYTDGVLEVVLPRAESNRSSATSSGAD